MHIRVTRGSFDLSRHDEVVALSNDLAKEAMSRPGVTSCRIGLSPGGVFFAVTEGESAEAVDLSRESLGDLLPRMATVLRLDPPETFELVSP
jgi:hypothetical protein